LVELTCDRSLLGLTDHSAGP